MDRHLGLKANHGIGNGHQATQLESGQLGYLACQRQHVGRRNARFGLAAVNVDLQAHVEWR